MLVLYFITFIGAIYSAYGSQQSHECYKRVMDECNGDRIPKEFPDTASKLQEACSIIPEHLTCAVSIREDCDPLSDETKSYREINDNLHSMCDKDSPTLKVLTENIECIAGSVKKINNICHGGYGKEDEDPKEFYRQMVESHVEDYDSLNGTEVLCIHHFYTITCVSVLIDIDCGDEAAEISSDVGNKFYFRSMFCSEELLDARETIQKSFREALNSDEEFVDSVRQYNENEE